MTTTTKTPPRLGEAIKEFNVGRETLVAFLVEKGFEISNSPATKLTDKMYHALQVEFAQDKAAKRKSDEIVLAKGSMFDSHRRQRDDAQPVYKEKEKEKEVSSIPAVVENKKAIEEKPVIAAPQPAVAPIIPPVENKISADNKPFVNEPLETKSVAGAPVEAKLEVNKIVENKITDNKLADKEIANTPPKIAIDKEEKPIVPSIKTEASPQSVVEPINKTIEVRAPEVKIAEPIQSTIIQPIIVESKKEEKPESIQEKTSVNEENKVPGSVINEQKEKDSDIKIKASETEPTVVKLEKTEPEIIEPEHLEIKAPKLEGPNILGKINLDEMNLASRPKKGAVIKKKPDVKPTAKPEIRLQPTAEKPQQNPIIKETEKENEITEAPTKVEPLPVLKPIATVAPVLIQKESIQEPEARQDEPNKPEHIEFKGVKLDGPKIIGKIELPVAQPAGFSKSNAATSSNNAKKEKRKRKRIPVDKKPEGGNGQRTDQPFNRDNRPQSADGNRNNIDNRNKDNRPRTDLGGNRNIPGQGTGNDRPRQAGTGFGTPNQGNQQRPDNRQGNRPDNRIPGRDGGANTGTGAGGGEERRQFRPMQQPTSGAAQQEIDAKAIQEKIRETQAKLSGSTRGKNLKSKYRRSKRDEMAEKRAAAENAEVTNTIQVTEFISVSELANLLDVNFADVISKCMSLGIMVSINQRLDAEVIELVASEFGFAVEFINLEQEEVEEEEVEDDPEDMEPRAPIVTIMGHVDHGKTSLLDYIRSANVVAGEAGGITQHIGAYQVTTSFGKKITFLDTPGHEAFTAMRARGAKVADVAVIVIAADDTIMPQTKEAISHAQAGNLPMIFAINKIDKPGANPEKIKEALAKMNILVEDWGGKYQSQDISAKKGENIDLLLEKIGLEAELLELKANPDRIATGSVIEASLDKGRGYQSTILVQNGKLFQGEMIVCGQYYGKIKAMFNERGQRVKEAGPSTPVQVLGLNGAPQAGEKFKVYKDENEAKDVATHRSQILREQGIRARKHITLDEIGRRLALGNFKELRVIIKGDFDGSVEALSDSLQKLSTPEVAVHIVHKAVGQITESDVLLATASDGIILGFQVRPSMQAAKLAEQENIEIRTYSIIYDAIDEIKSAMEGLLEPKVEKKTVSNIEVREIYKISGIGTIAGCYVLDGKMTRQTKLNLVRDGIVVFTGELGSLKRFKDDVKDVSFGYECGLTIKNYNDVRVGDIIEGYEEVEVKRTLA